MPLFEFGWFCTHSKLQLPWKLDCDALTNEDIAAIAKIITGKFAFSRVYGVPRGGTRLAAALAPFCEAGYPPLIVDDVLTTGRSMEAAWKQFCPKTVPLGVVIVARGELPPWVWAVLSVNEWAQSRATGLG